MATHDAFGRALRQLSMPELQALWNVMSADDRLTPRQRLATHLKLEWFRRLPSTQVSVAWLALCRDGVVDIPTDFLPALDTTRIPSEAPLGETRGHDISTC